MHVELYTPLGPSIAPLGWGIPRYPGVYPSPVEQWTDIGVCITQRARMHTGRTTMPISCPPWSSGSCTGLRCCISIRLFHQGSFSWVQGFESLPSHILNKFCILGTRVYRCPVEQWTDKGMSRPVTQWALKFRSAAVPLERIAKIMSVMPRTALLN